MKRCYNTRNIFVTNQLYFTDFSSKSLLSSVLHWLMNLLPILESWSHTRWLDPSCSWMRLVSVSLFMVVWQVVELNTFFVKHIFPMPTEHPICVARILLMGLMAAPATR